MGNNTKRYVLTAAASDIVKYGITAGLALQVVQGAFLCILTTVLGGMLGNYLGHFFQNNKDKFETWKNNILGIVVFTYNGHSIKMKRKKLLISKTFKRLGDRYIYQHYSSPICFYFEERAEENDVNNEAYAEFLDIWLHFRNMNGYKSFLNLYFDVPEEYWGECRRYFLKFVLENSIEKPRRRYAFKKRKEKD